LGLSYCEYRDNAGQYCKSDDHRISYCFINQNAQLKNCTDNKTIMKSRRYDDSNISGLTALKGYCKNPNIVNVSSKLGQIRDQYCSQNNIPTNSGGQ